MRVVVASADLSAGSPLEHDVLAQRNVPTSLVPADAVPPEVAAQLLGQRLLFPLSAGEPVRAMHLARAYAGQRIDAVCAVLEEPFP